MSFSFRVVVAILDGFHFYETSIATVEPKSIDSDEPDEMPDIDEDNITESQVTSGLETSQKIYDSVVTYLIPKLSQCLQRKVKVEVFPL